MMDGRVQRLRARHEVLYALTSMLKETKSRLEVEERIIQISHLMEGAFGLGVNVYLTKAIANSEHKVLSIFIIYTFRNVFSYFLTLLMDTHVFLCRLPLLLGGYSNAPTLLD